MKIDITAFPRSEQGTGHSRRMRRKGMVPGVVYGGSEAPQLIQVDHHALSRHLKMEAFHASILGMTVEGESQRVLLRDFQMHPWRQEVLHIDFQRVASDRKIHMKVPLHFMNQEACKGVKTGGAVISHVMTDIDVQCLPDDLPEYIEVDLGEMEVGQSIHVADLALPKGVELVPHLKTENPVAVTLVVPRGAAAEEAAAGAGGGAAAEKK